MFLSLCFPCVCPPTLRPTSQAHCLFQLNIAEAGLAKGWGGESSNTIYSGLTKQSPNPPSQHEATLNCQFPPLSCLSSHCPTITPQIVTLIQDFKSAKRLTNIRLKIKINFAGSKSSAIVYLATIYGKFESPSSLLSRITYLNLHPKRIQLLPGSDCLSLCSSYCVSLLAMTWNAGLEDNKVISDS